MKTFIVLIALIFAVGCSTVNPKIAKWDKENYQANKKLAIEQMQTWSLNSGFIVGSGLTSRVSFPIKSGDELRAIIDSPGFALALVDLDTVCKELGYWSDTDYKLGFALGAKVRAGSQAVIQFVKDFFPELTQYAPALFGL